MEIGVDSFASAIGETNIAVSPADRMRDLLEEIEHADQVVWMYSGSANIIARNFSIQLPR